ncbi:MAG: DUF177 domain-containing protein [Selenomonadaceae bacterium]|nr:DUF177 domain-containing protein [Selenomonadaceae bacterium]
MPKVQTARGGKVPFEFSATAEKLFGEDFAADGFEGDVKIFGEVEDVGRCYVVRGNIRCKKSFTCDRCLTPATANQVHEFEEEFDKSEAVDDLIDVTELLHDVLLAGQPMKNLCKTDCKGLCPKCGANLNEGECGCDNFVVDPRLAALQQLVIRN